MQDQFAKPWDRQNSKPVSHKALVQHQNAGQCSGTAGEMQGTADTSSTYWYEVIEHNGESSFLGSEYKDSYKVFRNVVKDYGADNTGGTDASEAIERAIKGKIVIGHQEFSRMVLIECRGTFERPWP